MSRYWVEKADPERDGREILAVLNRNHLRTTEERLRWNQQGGAQWWLVRTTDSLEVVGICGLFPRRFRIAGAVYRTAIIGDWAVDKAYRTGGPVTRLTSTLSSHMRDIGCVLFYAVPNEKKELAFRKLGSHKVGEIRKYVKVLRTEYRRGVFLPPQWLMRSLAKPLDRLLAICSREHGYQRAPAWSVETPSGFDERFDRLWQRAAPQFEIIGERTAAYLQWRYADSPDREYQIFAVCDPDRELAGYAVYYLEENVCRIADLLYRDEGRDLHGLLSELLRKLRRERVFSVSIRYLGRPALTRVLKQYGFHHRESGTAWLMLHLDPDLAPEAHWDRLSAGHFMDGDNDI